MAVQRAPRSHEKKTSEGNHVGVNNNNEIFLLGFVEADLAGNLPPYVPPNSNFPTRAMRRGLNQNPAASA